MQESRVPGTHRTLLRIADAVEAKVGAPACAIATETGMRVAPGAGGGGTDRRRNRSFVRGPVR